MVTKSSTSFATDTSAQDNASAITTNRESGPAPKGTTSNEALAARPKSFRVAFDVTAEDRAQLPKSALGNLGPLDPMFAINTAIASAERLDARRDQIATRFPEELITIDKIDTYARAAAQALTLVNTSLGPPAKLPAVYEAGLEARRLLVSDLTNLTNQRLISREAPKRISNDAGHNNVANDILACVQFLTQSGPEVLDKVATPLEKLPEYEQLAYELIELSSLRVPHTVTTEQARDDLARALTLLVNAYGVAERVMAFFDLRDQAYRNVVPSLYSNKSRSRKGGTTDTPAEPNEVPAELEQPAQGEQVTTLLEPSVAGARGGSPFAGRDSKA